jgi:hypothetical protein
MHQHTVPDIPVLKSAAFYFAASQAASANVHLLVSTVDLNGYSLNIRIPDCVGSSMRMADVVAKMSALATDITLCHA